MVEDMGAFVLEVRKIVADRLDLLKEITDEEIQAEISKVVMEISKEQYLTLGEKKELLEGVFNSMRGLDVLQPLVDDPSITEIMINGPHRVFVEQAGKLYQKNISFGSNEKLENIILNIVAKVNRTVKIGRAHV